ncbi:molybdopterin molybdenumtransferase MoeA [Pseudomonas kairouanensis]|uniref:Molybdopterin molybdenumtransferase n=1 Tax=Pseudomonas kairouanensis TaxID=2293832 RepID=A0A4Z0AVX8_9PSED|nr:molybdopterin molybdotransferase MoeA [Pseudomonas kairouanensis]TFY90590.1 molybdopterin molybdenumtransferase MoeA [Pseudomonas kairouanensis]
MSLSLASPALSTEVVALAQALGRVTAEDVFCPLDLPGWDTSSVEGYALRAAAVPEQGGYLGLGSEALPVAAGMPLPPGTDSVVPQMRCRVYGSRLWCPPLRAGEHVRPRGEELQRGQRVLCAGQRLRAQELGLLAAAGIPRVKVYRALRVCLLNGGDGLREPGESLARGQVFNSNRYLVAALLRRWGVEVQDYEVLVDALTSSQDALALAASECDVLLSTGGASAGEKNPLEQLGKPWIGLPRNPADALVTTLVVVRPFLLRAQGAQRVSPTPASVPAGFDWLTPDTRRHYLLARLSPSLDGQLRAILHPQQNPPLLTAACWADGLVIVEADQQVFKGTPVPYLSFADFH